MHPTYDRIRALGAREFHPERWRELCELLAGLPPTPELTALVEDLEPLLKDWPEEWRATMCGMGWDEEMIAGRSDPRHRIVRYLRYDSVFVGRYGSIMMRSPRVRGAALRGVAGTRALAHLRRINFHGQADVGDVGAAALAQAHMPRLHRLDLGGAGLGRDGVAHLATAPWARQLTELVLDRLPDADAIAALAQGTFDALESLSLAACVFAVPALGGFDRARFPALRALTLSSSRVTGPVLAALGERLPEVRTLHLRDCALDAGCFEALATWPRLEVLEADAGTAWSSEHNAYLGKREQRVDAQDALAFLARVAPALRTLSLRHRGLGPEAARVLAAACRAGRLAVLRLDDNPIGQEGLDALLAAPSALAELTAARIGAVGHLRGPGLARLTSLELGAATLADEAFDDVGPAMRRLRLRACGLTARSVRALTHGGRLAGLTTLDLSKNPIGRDGLAELRGCPALDSLVLEDTDLGRADPTTVSDTLQMLSDAGLAPSHLMLPRAGLDDAAIVRLANSPLLARVTSLGLSGNAIGDAGARALAASPKLRQLETLYADANRIGPEGVRALGDNSLRGGPWMNVRLENNSTEPETERYVQSLPSRCCP